MSLITDLDVRDRWLADGRSAVAVTVIAVGGTVPRPAGSRMLIASDGEIVGSVSAGCVESEVVIHAAEVLASGEPQVRSYGISDEAAFQVGLACGGTIRVLIEPW
ncbi:MAG: XdhC family protein [Acidimicrobiia bacterium]